MSVTRYESYESPRYAAVLSQIPGTVFLDPRSVNTSSSRAAFESDNEVVDDDGEDDVWDDAPGML